jgi:hypothetical protein
MNLKGIMQTLGAKPGQVVSNPYARAFTPQVETIVKEEEDHEVSMANNSIDTIIKMATELKAKMGEDEKEIPAWIQDHIAKAENLISQASSNYHEYGTNEAGINGADRFPTLNAESVNESSYRVVGKNKDGEVFKSGVLDNKKAKDLYYKMAKSKSYVTLDVVKESVNEEVKDWDTIHNVFVKFLKANTKELEKRVLSKDEDATKKAIKSIVSGLTNAQRSLKMESVNEVSYNVKADNAYQFINGATAVLGMYLKDEKLESGVKNTLQRVVKDLEGLRKYFFSRKDESVNKSLRLTKLK